MDKTTEIMAILDQLGMDGDASGLAELIEQNEKYKEIDEKHGTAAAIEMISEDFPRLIEWKQPQMPTYNGHQAEDQPKKRPKYFPGRQKTNILAGPIKRMGYKEGQQIALERHKAIYRERPELKKQLPKPYRVATNPNLELKSIRSK